MNLPCLCFVDELLDQEEIETDVPKATSRHVRAGHGQRAAVWEWELLAAAEPVQNWPKVTLGARLPSRIHVQVRRGHVSPHEHGADHAPAAPFTASPGSPPPAFHKERMPGLIRGRQPANLNICSWAPPHLPTGEGTDDNWNMPCVVDWRASLKEKHVIAANSNTRYLRTALVPNVQTRNLANKGKWGWALYFNLCSHT